MFPAIKVAVISARAEIFHMDSSFHLVRHNQVAAVLRKTAKTMRATKRWQNPIVPIGDCARIVSLQRQEYHVYPGADLRRTA
jgi:hypothetical protein